ncbi:hypothetical protein Bbelb_116950 [Branchiostoma belcheri]|nr:hypothetical protein Bbelb_116950 [Branchiostoma belcheri]
MGKNLRHVLIFLLIILKEPNMLEADCSASCVKHAYYPSFKNCDCPNLGLTNIPQNLPSSTYKRGRDSDSGSNSNPTLHNTKDDQLDQTGQGQSQTITESDTSTTAVVVSSGLDHEYEDIDQHNQTRQGRSWVITESNRKTPSVITRRDSDHQYEDVDRHNQKRQGQAQTIPTSNTKTEDVVTSDHQYEIMKQQNQAKPNAPNPSAESLDSKSVKTPPKDPKTTYTNITSCSGHDQTGLAKAQANTESLSHVRNPSNTTGPAVMQAHNHGSQQTSEAQTHQTGGGSSLSRGAATLKCSVQRWKNGSALSTRSGRFQITESEWNGGLSA